MRSERNAIFDYAKGIGIVLLVYGHVVRGLLNARLPMDTQFHGLVDSIIYSFHMPLFFFLSGSFFLGSLARRGLRGLVLSKLDTIVYPYVVWSLIQGLLEMTLSGSTNGSVTLEQVLSLLWLPRAHFWFLYELFAIFLVAGLLYRRSTSCWIAGVLVVSFVLYVSKFSPIDLYVFNSLGLWFVFFAFGVSVSVWMPRIAAGKGLMFAFVTVVFLAGQGVFHESSGLRADSHPMISSLLLALVGIAFVTAGGRWLMGFKWSWLEYLGRHSMEIYLAHVIAGSGIRIILHKLFGVTDIEMHLVSGLLCSIALPLILVDVCRRTGMDWLFHPPPSLRLAPSRG